MSSSPSHKCVHCLGSGREFALDVRPPSAGVPEQTELEDGSVALWYPDGTTGTVKSWLCAKCKGTGLRTRFGPCDVRATEAWVRRNGIVPVEPVRTVLRGTAVNGASTRDGDALSGERFVSAGTPRSGKASTTVAHC